MLQNVHIYIYIYIYLILKKNRNTKHLPFRAKYTSFGSQFSSHINPTPKSIILAQRRINFHIIHFSSSMGAFCFWDSVWGVRLFR